MLNTPKWRWRWLHIGMVIVKDAAADLVNPDGGGGGYIYQWGSKSNGEGNSEGSVSLMMSCPARFN